MGIEAPPITPVLTNPLTIILAGIGLYRILRKPECNARRVAVLRLVLVGHASAVLLILTAMSFTLRYRFDFSPFMTLAALIGYGTVSISITEARGSWRKRVYGYNRLVPSWHSIQPLCAPGTQSVEHWSAY
jgi:hypothetical protein